MELSSLDVRPVWLLAKKIAFYFGIPLLSIVVASCGMNQQEQAALGCYDVHTDSSMAWPDLQFTDEKLDYDGHRWRRIITHDPVRKLSLHSLWRFDGDTLHLIFAPDDHNVSDNYGSWLRYNRPIMDIRER